MKKKSSRKSPKKGKNFLSSKNVTWFGIDIHRIALGVSIIGCVVGVFLVQKQKTLQEESAVLAAQTGTAVPYVKVGGVPTCIAGNCANISPVQQDSCIPRPPCLDHTPRCMIPEPARGWCPVSGTPTPSVTPPSGCTYKTVCLMILCSRNNPNCHQCRQVLTCPSGVPIPPISGAPAPTCIPRPWCVDHTPRCLIAEPAGGWCPTTGTPMPHPTCGVKQPCPFGKICPQAIIACPPVTALAKMLHTATASGQKTTVSTTAASSPMNSFASLFHFFSKFFAF